MHRRKFFKFGLLGFAAVAAGRGAYVYFEKFDVLARKIILADTAALNIDKKEYDLFFADIKKAGTWDAVFFSHHKQILKWHYYTDNSFFSLPYKNVYDVNRSKLVGMFLLSTNYFYKKNKETEAIRYIGLHDPYKRPCSNPFSNIYNA